ncbi:unnamed protein product [Caenorhabditis auriculariae]|uniref:Uncharacterized protein n=1 Tax=Caenorhabditis auriculariae TaxID=2777116 RepID=A0A8S1HXY4_9PELO|nr:unnamed protein product [Caenorhabditis auriculariae]
MGPDKARDSAWLVESADRTRPLSVPTGAQGKREHRRAELGRSSRSVDDRRYHRGHQIFELTEFECIYPVFNSDFYALASRVRLFKAAGRITVVRIGLRNDANVDHPVFFNVTSDRLDLNRSSACELGVCLVPLDLKVA